MNNKIVVLHISSYAGISAGAIHCYGSLNCRDKRIELKQKVTEKNVLSLSMRDFKYEIGTMTERFECEEDVRVIARRQWRKFFPDAVLLLEGSAACGDPQRCLVGPVDLKKEINRLKKAGEKVGGYEGDEKGMTKISDEYMNLLKKNSLWG